MKTASVILGLSLFLACASTWADEGLSELESSIETPIENEQLNISGNLHEKKEEKQLSKSDQMALYRKKVEKQNEERLIARMQQQRLDAEMKMIKELEDKFKKLQK